MDGQTSVARINFVLVAPIGVVFVDGVDTSGQIKDADSIAIELAKRIESIGSDNIVQVVTDSAGSYVVARKKLAVKYLINKCLQSMYGTLF
jgi:Protein of unknown function (DUF 659)